ncbi:MAG: glycosyltransferase [Phenylobacterium sp.]|uniref:glycosyltransferase family protein n=1 Tax=Phenylobacterium sp. TaxID=1871053 RepID=UPI003919D510
MRIVLYKGQSQYGSLRLHADQLAQALAELGHEASIVDLLAPDANDRLKATFDSRPDAYLGFGGVGVDIQSNGVSIYDLLGAAFASVHVDHPVHHIARLSARVGRHAAFFLDRSHVEFVRAWPGGRSLAAVAFMPPGANELAEPADTSDAAFAARDIGLLFTGTYRGEPGAPWRAQPEGAVRTIMEDVAQRMRADATLPILKALDAALRHVINAPLTEDLLGKFAPVLSQPQLYAEAWHRNALVEVLGAAGAPMTVYGKGWGALAERFPSLAWGGEGSFEQTLSLLRRARLVLNTNNGFVDGGHERVFTAMCGGAAVISDANPWYAEAFAPAELSTFEWRAMDAVPAQIEALLADPAALAAQARAGAAKALAGHTWRARAQTLVQTLSAIP